MAGGKRGRPRAQATAPAAAPAQEGAQQRRAGPQRTPQTPFEAAEGTGDATLYQVDHIRNVRFVKGVRQYEVVREGYGPNETTWEPMNNLTGCAEQIRNYEKKRAAEEDAAKEEALRKRQRIREEKERQAAELRARAAAAAARVDDGGTAERAEDCEEQRDANSVLKKHEHKAGVIWTVFDLTKEIPTCKCKNSAGEVCNEAPSTTAGTTNYWSHLYNHHRMVWLELKRAQGKLNPAGKAELQKLMEAIHQGQTSMSHSAGGEFLSARLPPVVKETMDRMTSAWIIDEDQAFNAACTPGFRRMMSAATNDRYDGCANETVKAHMTAMADEGRKEVQAFHATLKAQGVKPAMSGDLWSKNRTALFGIVTHGIRREQCIGPDGFMKSKWVMVEKLCGSVPCSRKRHTGEHIGELSDAAWASSGLHDPVHDIFARVSDNGSNMIKGWQEGFQVSIAVAPAHKALQIVD